MSAPNQDPYELGMSRRFGLRDALIDWASFSGRISIVMSSRLRLSLDLECAPLSFSATHRGGHLTSKTIATRTWRPHFFILRSHRRRVKGIAFNRTHVIRQFRIASYSRDANLEISFRNCSISRFDRPKLYLHLLGRRGLTGNPAVQAKFGNS
jgi:hypothetical protein